MYVSSYYSNSAQRSLLVMPMEPDVLGGEVCLFGHQSIPYADPSLGNSECSYQGGTKYQRSEYEVVLPIYGLTRVATGGSAIAIVPGTSQRTVISDATMEFAEPVDGRLKDNVKPDPKLGTPTTEEDVGACAQRCLDFADVDGGPCESFSFYEPSNGCHLYAATINATYPNYCDIEGYSYYCTGYVYYERRLDRNCEATEWSSWSTCHGNACGVGVRRRSRHITRNATGLGYSCGALEEEESCTADTEWDASPKTPSNVLAEWYGTSIDGAIYDSATRLEQVSAESVQACATECASHAGCVSFDYNEYYSYCNLRDTRSTEPGGATFCTANGGIYAGSSLCTSYAHYDRAEIKDCALGQWSEWGDCSSNSDCSTGASRNRTRSILQQPAAGGAECEPLVLRLEYVVCDPNDECPLDDEKLVAGVCGCGTPDNDDDGDGYLNCVDACPDDALKNTTAGQCGCGDVDVDSDADGVADCLDDCPHNATETSAGACGCGVAETDSDADGTPDCHDECPTDALKTVAGLCGCGNADSDADGDGFADCVDGCSADPSKIDGGVCGCGISDLDTDGDGTPNCVDACPSDPLKNMSAGVCGCGVTDEDVDGDGANGCTDGCPLDGTKVSPGVCGCGTPDIDADNDGAVQCLDACDNDPLKVAVGTCGCGVADTDTDGDATADCHDECPTDASKTTPGECGCGVADTDTDSDGTPDCNDTCPATAALALEVGPCGCSADDADSDGVYDCVDGCPDDPAKTDPGDCGCGTADTDGNGNGSADCLDACGDTTDSDSDGTLDCLDACSTDPLKTSPGACGCSNADTDTDGDGVADCNDACSSDNSKVSAGACGCGVPDLDSDADGTPDCVDGCPTDPSKQSAGECGCGIADLDSDGDGVMNCVDLCPFDVFKNSSKGACGCGVTEADTDADGVEDCLDACPTDANKTAAGICGCGNADTDSDGDGLYTCDDACDEDPDKAQPGQCGCGNTDDDSDADGSADCVDECPADPSKHTVGECGCGVSDKDSDGDGVADCDDSCPTDATKVDVGLCGCNQADTDSDSDGTPDCDESFPLASAFLSPLGGQLYGSDLLLGSFSEATADNCADRCVAVGIGCESISYSESLKSCKLHGGVIGWDDVPNYCDIVGWASSSPCTQFQYYERKVPRACQVDAWGPWGPCVGPLECGNGQQTRSRQIARNTTFGGAPCAALMEQRSCNASTSLHVATAEQPEDPLAWFLPTISGSVYQGDTQLVQHSGVLDEAACAQRCLDNPECVAADYNAYNKYCSLRSKRLADDGADNACIHNGGMYTNSLLCKDYVHMERLPRRDCVVTEWSPWTVCSINSCGEARSRNRSIAVLAEYGGSACPEEAMLVELQSCDVDDECPDDPKKSQPGVCGCGVVDDPADGDSDGTPDCADTCATDAVKTAPGVCGCGVSDDGAVDSDGDGTADCVDACPGDPLKQAPGVCGCGVPDTDVDGDGTADCVDECASDPDKVLPGACGCGEADDANDNGVHDCLEVDVDATFEAAATGRLKDNVSPSPNIGAYSTADTVEECAQRCVESSTQCQSMSYSSSLRRCYIHSDIIAGPSGLINYCDFAGYETTSSCISYAYYERKLARDCIVSEWSEWGMCEGSACGAGLRFRQRSITSDAKYGGSACPVLSDSGDCDATTPWDDTPVTAPAAPLDWFEAPVLGSMVESATKIVRLLGVGTPGECALECLARGASVCLAFDYDFNNGYCQLRNAVLGDGSATNYCDVYPSSVGCTSYELYTRLDASDCALSAWSSWSNCTAQCDGFGRSRTRRVESVAAYGGYPCPPAVLLVDYTECDPSDLCQDDADKTEPGVCGCGVPDTDSDGDGSLDCDDECPLVGSLQVAGLCGCDVSGSTADGDADGTIDCLDACPNDSSKVEPGICGCGASDGDSDGDGALDCKESCPGDGTKLDQGICGCGVADIDGDGDGTIDCLESVVLNLFEDPVQGRLKDNSSPSPIIGSDSTEASDEDCATRCIDEGTTCQSFAVYGSKCRLFNSYVSEETGYQNYCDISGYSGTSECISWDYYVRRLDRDCVVSEWSTWSDCGFAECGVGRQQRERTITSNYSNYGSRCPELREWRTCNSSTPWAAAATSAATDDPTALFYPSEVGQVYETATKIDAHLSGVADLEACLVLCLETSGCVAADWKPSHKCT